MEKLSQIWSNAASAVKHFFEPPAGFNEFVAKGVPVQPLPVYLTLQHVQRHPGS
jgi:hypothetical protein